MATLWTWVSANSPYITDIQWNRSTGLFKIKFINDTLITYPNTYGIDLRTVNAGGTIQVGGVNYMAHDCGMIGIVQ